MKRTITFWNHSPVTFPGDKEIASAPLFQHNTYKRAYIEKDISGALHLWKYEGYGLGQGINDPIQMRTHLFDSATREKMIDLLLKYQSGHTGKLTWVEERHSLSMNTIKCLIEQLTHNDP